jgi:Flp pilus assembly protein TadG
MGATAAKRQHSRRRDAWRETDGSALVETAVSFTVFFSLLFCFMEVCLAYYSHDLISELAREGTRYAMYRSSACSAPGSVSCATTNTQVQTYVSGLGWPNLAGGTITPAACYICSGATTCGTTQTCNIVGSTAKVTVTYVFPIHLAFVPRNSITMTSVSEMPIVQ